MPYARAGETREARYLRIVEANTGHEYRDVKAVDSDAGWLERFKRDESGKLIQDGDEVVVERLTGLNLRIEIDEANWGSRNVPDDRDHPQRWVPWEPVEAS